VSLDELLTIFLEILTLLENIGTRTLLGGVLSTWP